MELVGLLMLLLVLSMFALPVIALVWSVILLIKAHRDESFVGILDSVDKKADVHVELILWVLAFIFIPFVSSVIYIIYYYIISGEEKKKREAMNYHHAPTPYNPPQNNVQEAVGRHEGSQPFETR